jgi:hypothetical protein
MAYRRAIHVNGAPRSPVDGDTGDDEDDEFDFITTDIGLYEEAVYDEYLGPLMGRLRRRLIQSLRKESPILAAHQVSAPCPGIIQGCNH